MAKGKHLKKRQQKNSIMQAAGILMIMMLISRILGYVRDVVLLSSFGQDYRTDAYYAAFNIPDFIYSVLLGGALGSAFIPIFTQYLAQDKEEDSWIVASTIFNIMLIGAIVLISLGLIFTPQLMEILTPGYDAQTKELAVYLTRIMFGQAFFMCLMGIAQGICHSYKKFLAPALGSVLYNVAIIVVGLLLKDKLGIVAFTLGVVFGAFLNFAVQIPTLVDIGLKYRPLVDLHHPGVKKFFVLLVPVFVGLSVTHLNTFVGTNLGSSLGEGVVTALSNAQRLMMLPVGVFAISIAVASFPSMASHVAQGRMDAYKEDLSLSFRTIVFINVPAAVGMAVLSVPIVRAMYMQGEFTLANMDLTADALVFYCIGLLGYGAQHALNRGFYAIQDTKSPVAINVGIIFINIVLSVILSKTIGYRGLPLAYSIAGLLSIVALLWGLNRKVGKLGGRRIIISCLKSLISAAVMGAGVYFASQFLENWWNMSLKWAQISQVIIAVIVGVIIYSLMAYLLKMEEMKEALKIVRRKAHRSR